MNRFVLGIACLLGLAAAASADVIHYKDGRTLEGTVLEQTATHLEVRTAFGTIKIERSKVARIEQKLTPLQELERRRASISDGDAGALFQLALWAGEQGLRRERQELLREVLEADPAHEHANLELGRVELDGAWFDADQVEDELRRIADEKRAQGLLQHEGEWLPEAEVMARRGFRLHQGEWLPRREAETREALADLARLTAELELPFRAQAAEGSYVSVIHDLEDPEIAEQLVFDLDALVGDALTRLQLEPHERERITQRHIPIYLLPEDGTARAVVEGGFFDRYPMSDVSRAHFATLPKAFGLHWPVPFLALLEGPHLDVFGDRPLARTGLLAHQVAEAVIERFKGGRRVPGWAAVGFVAWYEGATNYYSTLSLTSDAIDEDGAPIDLWVSGWNSFPAWRDLLKQERNLATVRPLRDLFVQPRERFDSKDAGVAWSLVRFLLERHLSEFVGYLRVYDAPTGKHTDELRRLHDRAWEQAFAASEAEIDAEWRRWALARPERFPTDELGR